MPAVLTWPKKVAVFCFVVWPTDGPGLYNPSLCLTWHEESLSTVTHCGWFLFSKTVLFEKLDMDCQINWLLFKLEPSIFQSPTLIHILNLADKFFYRNRKVITLLFYGSYYMLILEDYSMLSCFSLFLHLTILCCTSAVIITIFHPLSFHLCHQATRLHWSSNNLMRW